MENKTSINYFVLSGVSNDPQLQTFFFLVFLVIYLITLLGNMLIMLVIKTDPHLHFPMYFFLFHLSFLDVCYSSVTLPNMLKIFITDKNTISFNGCIAQMCFILLTGCTEIFMLSAMAYDRYAAICHPLQYATTMNIQVCSQLVGGAWSISLFYSLVNTIPVSYLHFCGPNQVSGFSCELPSVLDLSCMKTLLNEMVFIASAAILGLIAFPPTVISYIHIISTILRIRSVEGRRKAFSTCSSHLIVVTLYYGTALFRYLRPNSASSVVLDRVLSIQYGILTPMLNPIIYSLKNKEVKTALKRILGGEFIFLK
ncbi:olfactory receptor 1009-like [Trachemys scripta elegans]|uniref:olfactory receptor 1009-like n=1 Tax=Trachemys scripta elegans TaxID=31138 RepID=UPI001551A10E|nr:olfactory receptor 1009-like [Trachemys scripta elegans]